MQPRSNTGSNTEELTLGLLLTLDVDPTARTSLLRELAARADISVAPICGHCLPVALQTRPGEDRAALEALQAMPGVVFCDVVYAHFDDCEDAS